MAKPKHRAQSRYARESAELLALLIKEARVRSKTTVTEVAERAGLSRGLVHRIERGDLGCSIGAYFEVATIVGIPLFESESVTFARHLNAARDKMTLLPKRARKTNTSLDDSF